MSSYGLADPFLSFGGQLFNQVFKRCIFGHVNNNKVVLLPYSSRVMGTFYVLQRIYFSANDTMLTSKINFTFDSS